MKRNSSLMILLLPFFILQSSSIYDIQIESVQNNNISISSYINKKILITTVSTPNPDINRLQFLDSLQNSDTTLRIVVVPALDFGGIENNAMLAALSNSLGLDLIISKATYVKKSAGANQHILFKWLTDVNENSHFDMDVESIGQTFIVSKNGVLYSVLGNNVPNAILSQVLSQNISQ